MSRQYCSVCKKAKSTCICQWLKVQQNQIPVLIFQHSDELKKTLGTAPLVALGLQFAKVFTGTVMRENTCFETLKDYHASNPILLYARPMVNGSYHIELDLNDQKHFVEEHAGRFDSIILLDGTWRNTRELLHKNTWLNTLPTIALKNVGESHYRIRQATQENALATIEAVSILLSALDQNFNSNDFLRPFEKMIDTQIDRMGAAVYQRNYQNLSS